MMTSSNGNIFRDTGPLCRGFTGPGEFPTQRPVTRSFDVTLICAWINDWVNNHETGHYDVHVIGRDGFIHYWYFHSQQTRNVSQYWYGLMKSFNIRTPVDTHMVMNWVIVDSFTGLFIRRYVIIVFTPLYVNLIMTRANVKETGQ